MTTTDAFLGGRVTARQPSKGFRSGVDAVLLAASVPARTGDSVLELGCGVGVASLCLAARVSGLHLTGVEIQANYAALATDNARANAADMNVINADLRALPADLRQKQFSHVMMNPPYFDRTQGHAADDAGRDIAMGGDTPLADWIDIGIKRLAPKGTLTVVQHITRLPDVLGAFHGRLGSVVVRPIAGRSATAPNLFIAQGKHSGRAPFVLADVLTLHDPMIDGQNQYTPQIEAILRNGAALPISG